ncbi:4-alpha-glucanotransferase [Oceaniglobus indicus]|uniref:4-alpha-glucanotransferase n=1 Tax=Oceaniglobus indicus TaxID=2047749 RepID=UPI000C17A381|nr:4-alpha-glucanotransferase [Oceaniglobus indicus]
MTDALNRLADAMGILPSYVDQTGKHHPTSHETRACLLSAMGFDVSTAEAMHRALDDLAERANRRILPDWIVVDEGTAPPDVPGAWTLTREDGVVETGQIALPVLPVGIHRLDLDGDVAWLLVAPARLPEPPRTWGVTLPVYGLKTAEQGGIGTYRDLAVAMETLGETGAGFAGINPVHAGFPEDARAFSPYAPSSRRRFSTLHIDVGADPGSQGELIDYDLSIPRQNQALRAAFDARTPDPAFDDFLMREGDILRRFALHQALSAHHGPYWSHWPEDLRDPWSDAVRAFADANPDAILFHCWLQYLAESQLGQVTRACDSMALGLYLDLAVGTHPEGAETWADPVLFARGVSLGAPPDAFTKNGQRWNLAPMHPMHMARTGFHALAEILRAQLKFARVLRIDHILGFDRAFWVPDDPAIPGAYVRMPKAAMLAIARIEATRAGAVIIGEDLGNIPDGLQSDLAASGILGCRVTMFEQRWDADTPTFLPAAAYETRALTSFATHDLPTFAGWRIGRDIDWRQITDGLDDDAAAEARRNRAADVAALDRAMGGDGTDALNAFLAATPSRLVAVQAEDMLGHVEQPNLPGTVYDHPNWRRRLGPRVADLARAPGVQAAATTMKTAGR